MILSAIEKIVNLIAPQECFICKNEGATCCNTCWQEKVATRTPACFWCNRLTPDGRTCPTCRAKTNVAQVTIPFRLRPPLSDLIYQLKYNAHKPAADFLAAKAIAAIPESTLQKANYITFVPSTGRSQRKRGYNQAELIAREVGKLTRIPVRSTLVRIKHIDQIGLNRQTRLASVKNSFIVKNRYQNDILILVDDVVTTGSTLNECAKMLKQAGAKRIYGLAVVKK